MKQPSLSQDAEMGGVHFAMYTPVGLKLAPRFLYWGRPFLMQGLEVTRGLMMCICGQKQHVVDVAET